MLHDVVNIPVVKTEAGDREEEDLWLDWATT
jgi:hypothetical protein